MPEFTPGQLELIGRKRKSAGKRPKVRNKSTGADNEISRDFEAMLILASDVAKANASLFINVILQNLPSSSSRDLVLLDVLLDEFTHASSMQTSMRQFLISFNSVKDGFGVGPFADLPEVSQFIDDLQFGFSSFSNLNDRAQYELSLVGFLTIRDVLGYGQGSVDANLRSWISVINAYR